MTPDRIKPLIAANPAWFETQVMASALLNPRICRLFKDLICRNSKGEVEDFAVPYDNLIYEAARSFHLALSKNSTVPVPVDYLDAYTAMGSENMKLTQNELPMVRNRIRELLATAPIPVEILEIGIPVWLEGVRVRKVFNNSALRRNIDPRLEIKAMTEAVRDVNQGAGKQTVYRSITDSLMDEEDATERFGCSLKDLNTAMGGGFGRKESALIVAPEGGGKTVMGLQLALDFALDQNLQGLFISTEQGHKELLPRILTSRCNIPFSKIKDGVKFSRLTANEQEEAKNLDERLGSKLQFLHWRETRNRSIIEDMDAEIETYVEQFGKIDFVIFDWLNRGMGEMSESQLQLMRHYLQLSADHLPDMANKWDIIAIAMAQANLTKATNKARIEASMIRENSAMGQQQSWVLGISAMFNDQKKAETNSGLPSYADKQYCFLSKARKGPGGMVKIKREMHRQRFVDWK